MRATQYARHSVYDLLPIAYCLFLSTTLALLSACGRERVMATPIPPNVVRPVQPTPAYGNSMGFRLTTPSAVDEASRRVPVAPAAASGSDMTKSVGLPAMDTPFPLVALPPSTLGIVQLGATILEQPGGKFVERLLAGTPLTIIGKSADGRHLAVYTNAGASGWVVASQVVLFADDELQVIADNMGPDPIATLIAEAMQPVTVLDAALFATPVISETAGGDSPTGALSH